MIYDQTLKIKIMTMITSYTLKAIFVFE